MVTIVGLDLSERTIKYIKNGNEEIVTVPYALRENFVRLTYRMIRA